MWMYLNIVQRGDFEIIALWRSHLDNGSTLIPCWFSLSTSGLRYHHLVVGTCCVSMCKAQSALK
jgi:hypothetical protein